MISRDFKRHDFIIVINPKNNVRTIVQRAVKLDDLKPESNNRFLIPHDGGFVKAIYEGRKEGFYTFSAYYSGKMQTIKFGRIENVYLL